MAYLIQVTTINGTIVEDAKWKVDNLPAMRDGQSFHLELPTLDTKLTSFLKGTGGSADVSIYEEDGKYVIMLHCRVKGIRHSLNLTDGKLDIDTMVTISPVDRTVDNILTYIFNPNICDPRFLQLIGFTSS